MFTRTLRDGVHVFQYLKLFRPLVCSYPAVSKTENYCQQIIAIKNKLRSFPLYFWGIGALFKEGKL
jgi:hypothetical protein